MWQVMYLTFANDDRGTPVIVWQDYGEPCDSYRDALDKLAECRKLNRNKAEIRRVKVDA